MKFASLVLAASVSVSTARADLMLDAIGNPADGGSWFQSFSLESTTQTFENVGLVITRFDTTAAFEDPAWDFSVDQHSTGFGESANAFGMLTVASGAATNAIDWTSHFAGNRDSQNFLLSLFTFDNDLSWNSVQSAVAHWDGSSWQFYDQGGLTWEQYVQMGGTAGIVPLPASALLCLAGFAVVGVGRRAFAN